MGRSIEVRILGPVELRVDDGVVELSGRNERALVAFLALNVNRPVSTDAIIDALWGEAPPPTAREMVRTYVARARRRLGEVLQTRSGAYVLLLPPEAVDAFVFEGMVEEGLRQRRDRDDEDSARTLRRALSLWRGTPLEELQPTGVGDRGARLEALRLTAIEARVQAELSLGDAAELVPELELLVREYPYRERLRADLMLALYRAGRQTEALEQYLDARRRLVEEIGVEPGRELQQLHAAILRQDPALDPSPSLPPLAQSDEELPVRRSRPSTRSRLVAGAGIAILAAVGAAVILALSEGGHTSGQALRTRSVGVIDAVTGTVLRAQRLGGEPGQIAVGSDTAWVGDGAKDAIVAIDPSTLDVRTSTALSNFPYQLATDRNQAWVGNGFDGTLSGINRAGQVSAPFKPEPRSVGRLALAYGGGALWVGSQDGRLSEVSPSDDRTIAVVSGIGRPQAMVVGGGAVWIAEATTDALLRVPRARPGAPTPIPIGGSATGLTIADGSVWAVTPGQGVVWRVDERTGGVTASIDVGPNFSMIASAGGQIWVASPSGTAERVDPHQNAVVRTLDVVGPIGGLTGGGRRLWISVL